MGNAQVPQAGWQPGEQGWREAYGCPDCPCTQQGRGKSWDSCAVATGRWGFGQGTCSWLVLPIYCAVTFPSSSSSFLGLQLSVSGIPQGSVVGCPLLCREHCYPNGLGAHTSWQLCGKVAVSLRVTAGLSRHYNSSGAGARQGRRKGEFGIRRGSQVGETQQDLAEVGSQSYQMDFHGAVR